MPLLKMESKDNTKKLRSIFPSARLKKIMQSNEDVGKMGVSVPYIASKALELFLKDIVHSSYEEVKKRNVSRITVDHIKAVVEKNPKYEFLGGLFTEKDR